MSTWKKKQFTCGCCGENFEDLQLMGSSISRDSFGLDLNPHDSSIYENVHMCPKCGYSQKNVEAVPSANVTHLVNSEKYKSAFISGMDSRCKKNILAGLIYMTEKKYYDAANSFLAAVWFLESEGQNPVQLREQVIDNLYNYVVENADINATLKMVDCLRRNKEFNDAKEAIEAIKNHIDTEYIKKVFEYELMLIDNGDSSEHMLSEVSIG